MLTKMKIAIVIVGSLITGVAAAQGTSTAPTPKHAKRAEMIQKFDTNKDGKLDQTERTAAREVKVLERFKKLDTDGNGVLSLGEFKAGKQMGRHARGGGMKGKLHRGRHLGKGRGAGRGLTK